REARDHFYSGSNDVRLDGGKAIAGPGHSGVHRVPGIMNGTESEAEPGIEIVVETDQIFAPVRILRNGCGENGLGARATVGRRNHGQQRLRVRINEGNLAVGVVTPRVGIVRTVGGIGVYGRTLVAEIPLAIGRRRHEVIKVVGNILAAPVFDREKKGAVLPDRPANTEAVVVFLVTRL